MAPALDLLLAAGDRVSRIAERENAEYYPPRVTRPELRRQRPGSADRPPMDSLPPR